MVPRSRIETCSRSNCCRTLWTSPEREQLGHQLFDQLGMGVVHRIEQPLGLGAAQQLIGVMANHLGDDGC